MSQTRYLIEYDLGVADQLSKLPKTMQQRILKAIEQRLTIAPNDFGKPLTKEWKEHRRLRVGDYRVIYRVFNERIVVLIVEIDHRKDVYTS